MNIIHINSLDHGGAFVACKNLHYGLMGENIESRILVKTKTLFTDDIINIKQYSPTNKELIKRKLVVESQNFLEKNNIYSKKRKYLKKRPKGLTGFTFPDSFYDLSKTLNESDFSVLNLHYISKFIDYPTFFKKCKKPIVWTLHDMNPFSGGEHFEEHFHGINDEGKPKKREYNESDRKWIAKNIDIKRKALESIKNLHIVTPSKWLGKKAEQSIVFKDFPVTTIPNGIDTTIFKPYNQKFSRQILGLPTDKYIILFVAQKIEDQRKGYRYLQNTFDDPFFEDKILCSIGQRTRLTSHKNNIFELGSIKDERMMALVYSAADLFVIPSLADNLPNTVLESICCGTPVVGFPVGGIPEMIEDGKNGYICPEISVDELYNTVLKAHENQNLFNRSDISTHARNIYNTTVQAKKYIELYDRLLINNTY